MGADQQQRRNLAIAWNLFGPLASWSGLWLFHAFKDKARRDEGIEIRTEPPVIVTHTAAYSSRTILTHSC